MHLEQDVNLFQPSLFHPMLVLIPLGQGELDKVAFVILPNSLDNHLPEEKGAREVWNQMRCCEITCNPQYIKFTHFLPTSGEVQLVTALSSAGVPVAEIGWQAGLPAASTAEKSLLTSRCVQLRSFSKGFQQEL